jgi:hypothetical protein
MKYWHKNMQLFHKILPTPEKENWNEQEKSKAPPFNI